MRALQEGGGDDDEHEMKSDEHGNWKGPCACLRSLRTCLHGDSGDGDDDDAGDGEDDDEDPDGDDDCGCAPGRQ